MIFLEPTENKPKFAVGERVRIKTAPEMLLQGCHDVETISYLETYGFGGQLGIVKIVHIGKVISYYVETKIGTAVVAEDELAFIS